MLITNIGLITFDATQEESKLSWQAYVLPVLIASAMVSASLAILLCRRAHQFFYPPPPLYSITPSALPAEILQNNVQIDTPPFVLPTAASSSNKMILSPADFKEQLVKKSNTWASCSLEILYDALIQLRSKAVKDKPTRVDGEKIIRPTLVKFNVPDTLFKEDKGSVKLQSFIADVSLLADLQQAYELPEITRHFPALPNAFKPTTIQITNPRLQQIKKACIKLLQDEYMVIARLFLAETLEEKVVLLWDYMLPAKTAKNIAAAFKLVKPEDREAELLNMLVTNFDHYSYALAGLYLLAQSMQALTLSCHEDSLKAARLMLTYIDAAIKVVQSCNIFLAKNAAILTKLQAKKGPKVVYKAEEIRFDKMLERLQPIRHSLANYIEQDLLPAFTQKNFNFKAPVPAMEKARKKPNLTLTKKKVITPSKSKLALRAYIAQQRTHTQANTLPLNTILTEASTQPEIITAPIDIPSTLTQEENKAPPISVPCKVSKPVLTQASVYPSTTLSALKVEPEPILPVAIHPKVAALNKRRMLTYEQIFADRWHETKGITMDAVEKLVTQLGGYTKGAKGSRVKIVFDNKSVATIEYRHGGDKASELYKVSVALLQRGLAIAGFAPSDWEDHLSQTRDLIINFKDYAARRAEESKRGK
jgi:hypothetical protein